MSSFNDLIYMQPANYPCLNQLVPTPPAATGVPCVEAPAKTKVPFAKKCEPNKKEDTMSREYYNEVDVNIEAPKSEAETARTYLRSRLRGVHYTKSRELQKQFGLMNDERPQDMDEFVKRIKDGLFVIPEEHKNSRWFFEYIEWRDPSIKKDQKGFDAAWKAFEKAEQDVEDLIAISDAASALAAIVALEDWTFKPSKK